MSMRLQIIINDSELLGIKRAAKKMQLNVSAFVRKLICDHIKKTARSRKPSEGFSSLALLDLPSPPIDQILDEIEKGRW